MLRTAQYRSIHLGLSDQPPHTIGNGIGMNSLRASEHGIQLVDQARRKKNWTKTAEIWCSQGFTSRSTLNRFWARNPINKETFIAICAAVEVDWQTVVEREDSEDYLQAERSIPTSELLIDTPEHEPLTITEQYPLAFSNGSQYRYDWGDAPAASIFYGRQNELDTLQQWVLRDRCRLILLLGMGGIGKTTLAAKLARTLEQKVDAIIWRNLCYAPSLDALLSDIIQFLSPTATVTLIDSVAAQIRQLSQYLTQSRCLIVLDNVESILKSGDRTGRYQDGYEDYDQLFRTLSNSPHQSCLMLTSREQIQGLAPLEGEVLPVRSLRLNGLQTNDGQSLFIDKGPFIGTHDQWQMVVHHYAGNPLALKIVASTIGDFFNGDLSYFLTVVEQSPCLLNDVKTLLDQQFKRLTALEQSLMYWLAIHQEPVSCQGLWQVCVESLSMGDLLQALSSLQRRSLIEQAVPQANPYATPETPSSDAVVRFTLQPIVMDYVIHDFIEQVCNELMSHDIQWLRSHALMLTQAKDPVRDTQIRLILHPIIKQLTQRLGCRHQVADWFIHLLKRSESSLQTPSFPTQPVQKQPANAQYFYGNLINLLRQLDIDFSGRDFSNRPLWQANFKGVTLHNVNLTNADVAGAVFTETLGDLLTLAFSPDGHLLATGDSNGDVIVWTVQDGQRRLTMHGHLNGVDAVSFSPDGQRLASGGRDRTLRIWDIVTGNCLHVLTGHQGPIRAVVFNPEGDRLFSGSDDHTIQCWQCFTGNHLHTWSGHQGWVRSLSMDAAGTYLASGSEDDTIRLWNVATGTCDHIIQNHHDVRSLSFSPNGQFLVSSAHAIVNVWEVQTGHLYRQLNGHQHEIQSVAFCPGGRFIASASDDQTIKLWDNQTGACCHTLEGHGSGVTSVAFNVDRRTLGTGSGNHTIKLWNIHTGQCVRTLAGHVNGIQALALGPDSHTLISGHDDGGIRIWTVKTGRIKRVLQGHRHSICAVAMSLEGHTIASASCDQTIRLWNMTTGTCTHTLQGHTARVGAIAFSPDQNYLISGSDDQTIRVWDVRTGGCVRVLNGHSNGVGAIAASHICINAGSSVQFEQGAIASGSHDQTVKIWDLATGTCVHTLTGHCNGIETVSFSPDRRRLVTGSGDHTIRIWDVHRDLCLHCLEGHRGRVLSVAFSPNGHTIASGSGDRTIRLWNVINGDCVSVLNGHTDRVNSLVFSLDGQRLISGSQDQTIKVWDVTTGQCVQTLRLRQPYEGLNITGVRGLPKAQRQTLERLGAYAAS